MSGFWRVDTPESNIDPLQIRYKSVYGVTVTVAVL